jgi:hypothetical protein
MYGTIAKPSAFESYVSLNQLDDIDDPEENNYCINARNIVGCVLIFTTIYGFVFYILCVLKN